MKTLFATENTEATEGVLNSVSSVAKKTYRNAPPTYPS